MTDNHKSVSLLLLCPSCSFWSVFQARMRLSSLLCLSLICSKYRKLDLWLSVIYTNSLSTLAVCSSLTQSRTGNLKSRLQRDSKQMTNKLKDKWHYMTRYARCCRNHDKFTCQMGFLKNYLIGFNHSHKKTLINMMAK